MIYLKAIRFLLASHQSLLFLLQKIKPGSKPIAKKGVVTWRPCGFFLAVWEKMGWSCWGLGVKLLGFGGEAVGVWGWSCWGFTWPFRWSLMSFFFCSLDEHFPYYITGLSISGCNNVRGGSHQPVTHVEDEQNGGAFESNVWTLNLEGMKMVFFNLQSIGRG